MKTRIIFFDGICVFCSSSVQILLKLDKKNQFYFSTIQGEMFNKLSLKNQINESNINTIVFLESKDTVDNLIINKSNYILYQKSEAIFKIMQTLGFPYNLTLVFKIVPNFIRDKIYDFIAKYRYKIFGKTEQCMLPNKTQVFKFLK